MAELPEPLGLSRNLPPEPPANILLVDDNPANLLSLRALLDGLGQDLVEARSGEEALRRVQTDEFAVVLLDVLMPGMSGFETAKLIRGQERSRHTPIIFVTASDINRSQVEEGYALGAVDFLVKPLLPLAVQAKVRGFVELFQDKQRAKREGEQLRLLVHGTTEYAIFMLDPQGRVATWNAGAERLKGYKAHEIIGQHFSRFYPQDALDRRWPEHELKVAAVEGRFEDEGWRIRKDGSRFWANVVITALHDEAGSLVGYSKITRDLTERKRSEENARRLVEEAAARRVAEENARLIQEQRERLHVTLASIGDAVISTDAEGRVDFLNPVAENLVGWKTEEAARRPLEDVFRIVNEDTRQPVENPAVRALKDGVIVGLANHTVLIAKDGKERPIDDSAAPIRDAGGSVVGSVLVFRDISEKKEADKRLREQQEWLRVTLASIGDAVIATDTHGRVTFLNGVAEALTGWMQAGAKGQPLGTVFAILNEQTRQPVENPVEKVLRDGAIVGLGNHTVLIAKDGSERAIDDSAAPIRDAAGKLIGVVLTFRDVTEQRRVEQRRNVRLAVTHALSEADTVDDGASGVLKAVCENLGWDVGFFWSVAEAGTALRCAKSWHRPDVPVDEFETISCNRTFAKGEGLPGRVWVSGEPAWILDIKQDANFPRLAAAIDYDLHSAFAYPVVVGDQTLGVIEFFTKRIRDADADLLEMMGTVAGNVGQFIERKAAEEELRRSEQELTDFFENATVGLHWVGPDGTILRANQAELDMLGYRREEYVGRPIADFHADEDVICDILKRLQAGEKLDEYPARLRCKDGAIKDVLIDSSVLFKDGSFVHTRCFTRDITERKRAEEEVRFQARMLDTVGQAAVVTDPDGTIIYWNHFAETLYGWSRGEALGRNIIEVVVAPEATAQAAAIMGRLRAGENWSGEFLVRRRDGKTFTAFVTDTPLSDEQGKLKAIIGVSVDISDRKRVEQALRFLADASATLATLVDYQSTLQKVAALAVPHFADWCAVDLTEPGGTLRRLAVAHVDQAKVRLAQELNERYPAKRDVPHGAYQVLHTGKAEMMPEIPDTLLVETAKDEEHLRILRELGLKSYMCVPLPARGKMLGVITFVTAESGRCYTQADLAFAEELARRSAIAIENSQLYAQLREADRLKDEFLAMLAHELRNPLAPVRNALHILKQPGANGAMLQQVRDMAERQVQHMARLLDDLLDVSRISQGRIELRKEAVDVAQLVGRTVEAARPFMEERRHELTVSLPAGPLRVEADPTRLEQVLTNLLNNAAKYTDPGGQIWLTAERGDGEVVVRVRDTGIGIGPDMLPRIFDLFVQAERRLDRSQGGVGIGLTLVKKLVELHGGRVEASSAGPGRGSEFAVRLPALRDQHPGENARAAGGDDAPEVPRRRVLVVDDNRDAADSLALLLRLGGQDVRAVYDGPSALTQAKDFEPALVFLDIGMPGLDGYEVARRIRREPQLEGVVLVALTGWGQEEDRRRSTEAGFDHHLVKPVEPDAVQKLLAGLHRGKP